MELPAFQKRIKKEYGYYLHALWAIQAKKNAILT